MCVCVYVCAEAIVVVLEYEDSLSLNCILAGNLAVLSFNLHS
jgi:hypothetical protein